MATGEARHVAPKTDRDDHLADSRPEKEPATKEYDTHAQRSMSPNASNLSLPGESNKTLEVMNQSLRQIDKLTGMVQQQMEERLTMAASIEDHNNRLLVEKDKQIHELKNEAQQMKETLNEDVVVKRQQQPGDSVTLHNIEQKQEKDDPQKLLLAELGDQLRQAENLEAKIIELAEKIQSLTTLVQEQTSTAKDSEVEYKIKLQEQRNEITVLRKQTHNINIAAVIIIASLFLLYFVWTSDNPSYGLHTEL